MKKILLIILFLYFLIFEKTNDFIITSNHKTKKYDYEIGIIEIPRIGLKKKFYNNNNVDKNIIVIQPSQYPNVENSVLILAGHSGTGTNAYFNDLYKLLIGDYVYIRFSNIKYKYKITNIYHQQKKGKLIVYNDVNKTTLVLITCTNGVSDYQTIYICELI